MAAKPGGYAAALMAGLKEKNAGATALPNQNANPNFAAVPPPMQANGTHGSPPPVVQQHPGRVLGAHPYAEAPEPSMEPVSMVHENGRGHDVHDRSNGDPMERLNVLEAPIGSLPQPFAPVFTPAMGLMGAPGLDTPLVLSSGDIAETRDPLNEVLGQQFPCVRVQGVPYDAQCEEILMFFNDLTILDVVFSDRPGDAIVLFGSMMEVNLARARSGSNIRHRYVEILPASRREYYDAVVTHLKTASETNMGPGLAMGMGMNMGMGMPGLGLESINAVAPPQNSGVGAPVVGANQSMGRGGRGSRRGASQGSNQGGGAAANPRNFTETLRLRGLPFSATAADVVSFFKDFEVLTDGVKFVLRADGKVTGEAYVTFSSAEEAKKAMVMDRQSIGSRYIELFPSSPQEAARAR